MSDESIDNGEPVCFLIESSTGTFEVWLRQHIGADFTAYEPMGIKPVSGEREGQLDTETIARAVALSDWANDHPEVIREGKIVGEYDRDKISLGQA